MVLSILFFAPACKKEKTPTPPAKGSLLAANGQCGGAIVHGYYLAGSSVGMDTNYIQIQVNVTKAGTYKIETDEQNGVFFHADGTFRDTGMNVVQLKSSGLFTNAAYPDYTIRFDGSFCFFSLQVYDSSGVKMPDNSWRFTAGNRSFSGTGIGTSYRYPDYTNDGFGFVGSMQGYKDTSLTVNLGWFRGFDTTGYPSTKLDPNYFHFVTSAAYTGDQVRLDASPQTTGAGLHMHNQGWNIGVFVFSGTAIDATGNAGPITNGVFKATQFLTQEVQ
jgi:hypothetical protein